MQWEDKCFICMQPTSKDEAFKIDHDGHLICSIECYETLWEPMYESLAYLAKCEVEGCENDATTEWVAQDEEGSMYYTKRCEDHPEKDSDYHPREL